MAEYPTSLVVIRWPPERNQRIQPLRDAEQSHLLTIVQGWNIGTAHQRDRAFPD